MNHFKYGFRFHHDLQIIKAHDLLAQRFKIRVSLLVPQLPRRLEMLRPIHFDDKLHRRSMEIHDVRAKRLLPVKLYAENLFAAQP